jgi:hypothetical protein
LISFFGLIQQQSASKVARFGDEFCKFFQVLLVYFVKAILDSAINIDNGDDLVEKRLKSAPTLHKSISYFLPYSPCTQHRSKKVEANERDRKLTFPSCKIGTTISEALAASQAI